MAKKGKRQRSKVAFMCETAWGWEVGETDVKLYHTVEALEEQHNAHCGVVEVSVTVKRVVKREAHAPHMSPKEMNDHQLHSARKQLRQLERFIARLEKAKVS